MNMLRKAILAGIWCMVCIGMIGCHKTQPSRGEQAACKAGCKQTSCKKMSQEQQWEYAIGQFLVSEVGAKYLQGEICVPTIIIVATDMPDSTHCRAYGNYWIEWYNCSSDTLQFVSGGNHSGCITLCAENGEWRVTSFDQTEDGSRFVPSAKRIFGEHYEAFRSVYTNDSLNQASREAQLKTITNQ